jgi:hypothetical protein
VTRTIRLGLEDGGVLLMQADEGEQGDPGERAASGPVRAGRVAEAVKEGLENGVVSLREALEPVVQMSREVLDQLGRARADQVCLEFGVDFTGRAGVVLVHGQAGAHLRLTLTWYS